MRWTKRRFCNGVFGAGCVTACPFHTLRLADLGDLAAVGTPFFTPRSTPCEMCTDIPCVPVCPTEALSSKRVSENGKLEINKAKMGVAVVDSEHCIAFEGLRCEVCYRSCPLLGTALTIELKHNDRTGKHAMFIPVVNNAVCTGCGKCEAVCVTEKASIFVLPTALFGEAGGHYARGWDADDQARIERSGGAQSETPSSSKGARDYLNDGEL
ncbi:ferredoxin-type protein NapG [Campylobacterota bacterium]|nr:ferredoxin-type protein NapG [Campylobacterota bacterium]